MPVLRRVQRMSLAMTAPLISHYSETMAGIGTIRAFQVCRIVDNLEMLGLDEYSFGRSSVSKEHYYMSLMLILSLQYVLSLCFIIFL